MRSNSAARKIKQLKTTIQEIKAKVEMNTKRIKILVDTNWDKFMHQVVESMDKGWA